MDQFWETLKQIGNDFIQNTGLAIVRAVAFLVLGLVVIRIVQIIARSAALRSNRLDKSASTFVVSLITVVLYVALTIVVVSSLGFSTAGIIAAFSAVALAIARALKDSLASLANGVIIIFTKPFKKGDYVAIGGMEGLVQDIRLFNTKILTYSNETIIVPNSEVLGSKAFLLESVKGYENVVATPEPSVVLDSYGDSAVKLSVRAWGTTEKYWDLYYDLRDILYKSMKAHGVSIPFSQLDVHVCDNDRQGGANA